MKKRLLCMFLTLVMVLGMLPVTAMAAVVDKNSPCSTHTHTDACLSCTHEHGPECYPEASEDDWVACSASVHPNHYYNGEHLPNLFDSCIFGSVIDLAYHGLNILEYKKEPLGFYYYDGEEEPTACTHEHESNCYDCGYTAGQKIDHQWDEGEVTTEPGCGTAGVKTYTCSVCKNTYTEPVAATGKHAMGEWTVVTPASCAAKGEERSDCANCDHYETRDIAVSGHDMGEWYVSKEADYGEAGEERRDCANIANCKYYETRETSALTYNFSITYDANGGSGAPAAQAGLQPGTYTLSGTKPTKDGVVFIGWTAKKDTKVYAAGDTAPTTISSVTISDESVTVYAVYGLDEDGDGKADVTAVPKPDKNNTVAALVTAQCTTVADHKHTFDMSTGGMSVVKDSIKWDGKKWVAEIKFSNWNLVNTKSQIKKEAFGGFQHDYNKEDARTYTFEVYLDTATGKWTPVKENTVSVYCYAAPAAPDLEELSRITALRVVDSNNDDKKTVYGSTELLDGTYTVGDVYAKDGAFYCDVTITDLDAYVSAFNAKYDSSNKDYVIDKDKTFAKFTYTYKYTSKTLYLQDGTGWAVDGSSYTDVLGDKKATGKYLYVIKEFDVTYADGADGSVFADKTTSAYENAETPNFSGSLVRKGYVFSDWSPAIEKTVTKSVTYTAVWKEDKNGNLIPDDEETSYTIKYTDGVGDGIEVFADQVYTALEGDVMPYFDVTGVEVDAAGKPAREGYVFVDWNPAITEAYVSKDVTYEATWAVDANGNLIPDDQESKYTLRYDANGGKNAPKSESGLLDGETYLLSSAKPSHEKVKGVKVAFIGWTAEKDRKIYAVGDKLPTTITSVTIDGADVTVYAVYGYDTDGDGKADVLQKYHKVIFDSNGGSSVAVQYVLHGESADKPANPYRRGWYFAGWYLNGKLYDFDKPVYTDIVLEADWVWGNGKDDHDKPDCDKDRGEVLYLNTVDHVAYIIGYEDGTVRPNASITRAEIATIFFRLLEDDVREDYWSVKNPYKDVDEDAWYNTAVSTLYNLGVIVDCKTNFRPDDAITRAELAVLAAQFAEISGVKKCSFSDVSYKHWAADEIAIVEAMGWIEGYPNGTYKPDDTINRAEAVTIINRMLKRAVEADHMHEDMVTFPDNKPSKWYYEEIQEAANSHKYGRTAKEVGDEGYYYENWTRVLEAPDWARIEQSWYAAFLAKK